MDTGISPSVVYPMRSGDGADSYAKNSFTHGVVADSTKEIVRKEIIENLDTEINPPKLLKIADLGCSIGPNTFNAVEHIIESLESKYKNSQSKTIEFQVFFNDQTSNDFNTLFKSLPPNRRYYAAGVPGSFHSRIFPEASIHLVYCSITIHWLSQVPKEVIDKSSPAWSKGQIHYSNSGDQVIRAYKAQHDKDMGEFLKARAQEVVSGGLMILIVLGIPEGINHSEAGVNKMISLIGSCLVDLVKKGVVDEEKFDSFNVPIYLMTPKELDVAVKQNGSFSLSRIEELPTGIIEAGKNLNANQVALMVRSIFGELIENAFGAEIVEKVFDLYLKKIQMIPPSFLVDSRKTSLSFLAVLKRNSSQ